MSRWLLLLLILFSCWTLCLAQSDKQLANTSKPNLSGTWVLDHEADESGKSNKPLPGEIKLIVVHHEPEFRITQTGKSRGLPITREQVYYSDARGEENLGLRVTTNPSYAIDEILKSKTKWKGNKLVTQTNIHKTEYGHTLIMDIIDEWKLSNDGKTLIQTTTYLGRNGMSPADLEERLRPSLIAPPARPRQVKRVFHLTAQ